MSPENLNTNTHENQLCRASFKQHWAVAQIDGPMQTIARYDDVAKLLITIGGFLLAVLAGGYSAVIKDLRPYINMMLARRILVVVFLSMLVFFISAAAVCLPQPQRMAMKILGLEGDEDLTKYIKAWCTNVNKVIFIKRVLLMVATLFFIISFLGMTFLLLNPLGLASSSPAQPTS